MHGSGNCFCCHSQPSPLNSLSIADTLFGFHEEKGVLRVFCRSNLTTTVGLAFGTCKDFNQIIHDLFLNLDNECMLIEVVCAGKVDGHESVRSTRAYSDALLIIIF